jgi:hypothetical protein
MSVLTVGILLRTQLGRRCGFPVGACCVMSNWVGRSVGYRIQAPQQPHLRPNCDRNRIPTVNTDIHQPAIYINTIHFIF